MLHQPTLFPDQPKAQVLFLLDTSALVKLEQQMPRESPVFTAVWEELERRITNGQVKTIDFVETEVLEFEGKSNRLQLWVQYWKKHLITPMDEASYAATQPILQAEWNTGFFSSQKQAAGKDEADPYLIGFALTHDCIIVTEEKTGTHNKLPAVAAKNGAITINLFEFIEKIGIRMAKV
jgi:Domain of unknown function (DUF4411)